MPIVRVTGVSRWIPTEAEIEMVRPIDHPEWMITFTLLVTLRNAVAEAVNACDRSKSKPITPEQVVVIPERQHPWVQNGSELMIDIQPGNGRQDQTLFATRRAEIARQVEEAVVSFFAGYQEKMRPASLDIECRPLDSAGATISSSGEVIARWGQLDQA